MNYSVDGGAEELNTTELQKPAIDLEGPAAELPEVLLPATKHLGQLEEAPALVERLETMAQELMQLAGGPSPETLRQQAEISCHSL